MKIIIDAMGGIDLDIEEYEIYELNRINASTAKILGQEDPQYVTEAGTQHVDGTLAVSYGRIRKGVGNDYKRTERMRIVIAKVVEKVKTIMLDTPTISCTSCRYCTDGCPMSILIPDIFRTINTMRLYNDEFRPRNFYSGLIQNNGRAGDCVACGQCESVCPQHLPIIELLEEASGILDK